MKILCCVALLVTCSAHAGELLPTAGEQSTHMQQAIDNYLRPAVIALDSSIQVEPILESIDISGRLKRIWWGPLAGGSHVTLRVRVVDNGEVFEKTFNERAGAWKGTFRPGQDYDLVNLVASEAAEFVLNYRLIAK